MSSRVVVGLPARVLAFVLGAVFLCAATFAWAGPAQAQTSRQTGTVVPVSGKLSDGGTFKGRIVNPKVFATNGGKLAMSGTLKGKATTATGQVKAVSKKFTAPVSVQKTGQTFQVAQKTCPILNLNVGAIHLNLLGLVVNLSPINLNVTAVPGAGNLLGNLLCAVAGLLDGFNLSAVAGAIAALLNTILAGLFG